MDLSASEPKTPKYVSYNKSSGGMTIRIPLPEGGYDTLSIPYRAGEAEQRQRALKLRDEKGIALWGEEDWWRLVTCRHRPVARHYADGREPGVSQQTIERLRTDGHTSVSYAWVVSWYEDDPRPDTPPRRQRKRFFSYGTPRAVYPDSETARREAMEWRRKMYNLHYLPHRQHK